MPTGIWGNYECIQCGACCIDYNPNKPCKNQVIIGEQSYCSEHTEPTKDMLCRTWFCSELSSIDQHEFRKIAFVIGTAPGIYDSSLPT